MLLQCWVVMLSNAKTSHNEVRTSGSEPCKLFQLALHTVFQEVFLTVFTVTLMRAGLPYKGIPRHASSCTQCCLCPLPRSAQTRLHSALCWIHFHDFVQHDSNLINS